MNAFKHLTIISVMFASLLGFSSNSGQAAPITGWPAPGGTDFNFSGNIGLAGGSTLTLFNFDFAQFNQLWWGPANIGAAFDGTIDAAGETMTFQSASANTATWTGSSVLPVVTGPDPTLQTRFTATVTSGGNNWVSETSIGLPDNNNPAVVSEITSDPFTVNLLFEALSGGQWLPFLQVFNSADTPSGLESALNMNGQLFWTAAIQSPAPVPLPAAFPLLAGALGVLGLFGWRRKRMATA